MHISLNGHYVQKQSWPLITLLVTGYTAYILGKMFAGIRNKHKNLNYKYECDLSPGK